MRDERSKSKSATRKVSDVKSELGVSSKLAQKGNGGIPVISDGTVSTDAFDSFENKLMASHNDMVDAQTEEWNRKQKEIDEAIGNVMKSMKNIDIRPINGYIIVKPYSANPFSRIRTLSNGFVVPEFDPSYKDDGTGEIKEMVKMAEYAQVVEVSEETSERIFVNKGDIVFYQSPEAIPLPYYSQGFKLVSFRSIKAVINDKDVLDKRLKKLPKDE